MALPSHVCSNDPVTQKILGCMHQYHNDTHLQPLAPLFKRQDIFHLWWDLPTLHTRNGHWEVSPEELIVGTDIIQRRVPMCLLQAAQIHCQRTYRCETQLSCARTTTTSRKPMQIHASAHLWTEDVIHSTTLAMSSRSQGFKSHCCHHSLCFSSGTSWVWTETNKPLRVQLYWQCL